MSKQLYEEALADVKKVKQVAEDNAKRAVLEAVTPRIREFIDQALLNEHGYDDGIVVPDGEVTDAVDTDLGAAVPIENAGPAMGAPPGLDGKVTLDLDGMAATEPGTPVPAPMFGEQMPCSDEDEYEIDMGSIDALEPLQVACKRAPAPIDAEIMQIGEQVALFKKAGPAVRRTSKYREQITRMISRVSDMYDHVQERVTDPARKSSYETMLEAGFKDLNKLQESMTMSQKTRMGRMNEGDVTLKLTGLPDDIDLDTVGVDLITGDDEEGGAEHADADGDDAGLDDLDLGGDDSQEAGDQMEARELSDNTIVEIDENMLRREIAKMRRIRESHSATGGSETKPQSWGHGSGGAETLDDFGGGADEGDAAESEIVDKSPGRGALPLGEADEDLEEVQDQMDEADAEMDEAIDGPEHGGDETTPSNKQSRNPGESAAVTRQEGLRRLAFEKKLQERAKARAASLKAEAARTPRGQRLAEINEEYTLVAKRFNESVSRTKKMTQIVKTATKTLQEARLNSEATRPAENQAVDSLRKKLAETNLFNAKLLYTNKLLQNEQLTARQKAQVIKQLDTATTIREAKLVFESLTSTLASSQKTVTEGADRKVIGSGSRVTRPAVTQTLNEGHEADRWAQLAGITKK